MPFRILMIFNQLYSYILYISITQFEFYGFYGI